MLDPERCARGYYWVQSEPEGTPEIMELRDRGKWWTMGWDIPVADIGEYIVLAEVEPYRAKREVKKK